MKAKTDHARILAGVRRRDLLSAAAGVLGPWLAHPKAARAQNRVDPEVEAFQKKNGAVRGKPGYAQVRQLLAGRRLYIVPHSHIDWSWTHTRQWQAERAATALAEVLDILRTRPEYRYYVDTWNEWVEAFLDRYPERTREFRGAIGSGRIAVCGGTVCNHHPGWMEPEGLVRNMVLGRRLFRQLVPGFTPWVMTLLDVTAGPWQMPQILRKGGYRAFVTDRPEGAFTALGVPRNFVWKGMDGSEILVSRAHGGLESSEQIAGFDKAWEGAVETFYSRAVAPMADPRGARSVWIPMSADDVRPLRQAPFLDDGRNGLMPVPEFVREWNRRETTPLLFATPEEYFRDLESEADLLPRYNGILEPCLWTYHFGLCGNQSLRTWRTRAEDALVSAEIWSACAAEAGQPYPEQQFTGLWRELLAAYSHAQHWLFTGDFEAQSRRVQGVLLSAENRREEALRSLAAGVHVKRPDAHYAILFNDLPWERTECVEVWAAMPPGGAANLAVRDAAGRLLPHQIIDANVYPQYRRGPGPSKEFHALILARVPALGYTTVYFEPAEGRPAIPEAQASAGRLHTGAFDLELSNRGIERIRDAATGAVYAQAGNVVFNELNETGRYHFGQVTRTIPLSGVTWEVFEGPLRSSIRMRGSLGPHAVRLAAHAYPHARRIAFETEVESVGGSGLVLAVVGLPPGGRLAADVQFGVEARDVGAIPYEKILERLHKNVFYANHWVDYSDSKGGITLVGTTGEKGYEFFPEQPMLGHVLLKMLRPETGSAWERFMHPGMRGSGLHRFDYQLLLHSGDWRSGQVMRRAQEARHPVRVLYRGKVLENRPLPEEKSLVGGSLATAQITALYRQDGRRLMRLYEAAGQSAEVALEFDFPVARALETDFHGDPRPNGKALKLTGRTLRFALQPWEIVTVALE